MEVEYRKVVPVSAPPEVVVKTCLDMLLALGFRVELREAAHAELTGPPAHGSKNNPLTGASHIALWAEAGRLTVEASIGGVRKMVQGMTLLLGLVALAMLTLFGLLLGRHAALATLWSFAPFALLLPVFGSVIAGRTRRALDVFIYHVAMVAQSAARR